MNIIFDMVVPFEEKTEAVKDITHKIKEAMDNGNPELIKECRQPFFDGNSD